jgi:hypothetical protein
MIDLEMPPRIAARPRDARGYPVLFTSHVHPDGTPDFRVSDPRKIARCAARRLCGICGEKLAYWMVFISGPQGCAGRAFPDPPMHRDCAEYATRVCPYLATAADRSAALEAKLGEEFARMDPTMIKEKPDKLGLYVTRGYTLVPNGDWFLFFADPPKEIVWKELARR